MFEKYLLGFLKAWSSAIASGVLVGLQTNDWRAALISALVAGGVTAGVPNDLSRVGKVVTSSTEPILEAVDETVGDYIADDAGLS